MRTTLTLEKDVAIALERLRKARKASLKAVVNEALRQGLGQMASPPPSRRAPRMRVVSLGRCLTGNIDNISEVLATDRTSAEPWTANAGARHFNGWAQM